MRKTTGEIPFLLALRMEMAALDFTQRDLARAAGIREWQFSQILNGTKPLTPDVRARLVIALHGKTLSDGGYIVVTSPSAATREAVAV